MPSPAGTGLCLPRRMEGSWTLMSKHTFPGGRCLEQATPCLSITLGLSVSCCVSVTIASLRRDESPASASASPTEAALCRPDPALTGCPDEFRYVSFWCVGGSHLAGGPSSAEDGAWGSRTHPLPSGPLCCLPVSVNSNGAISASLSCTHK